MEKSDVGANLVEFHEEMSKLRMYILDIQVNRVNE